MDYREGAIVKAQFTADAERMRDESDSTITSAQARKSRLSPSIQMNIKDLNQNYWQCAAIFPELRELSVVARLMGLCSWLQKGNLKHLDLDELLAVELPSVKTPREKQQLVAAVLIPVGNSNAPLELPEVKLIPPWPAESEDIKLL